MKAVDPRLLRHARAARRHLAVTGPYQRMWENDYEPAC
jgi:hypothetical protein